MTICNVSGVSVGNALWTIDAISKLRQRPGAARRLVVEITETAPIQSLGTAARFVRDLKALGCRVALDDFGTGFVSIAHLRALGVDIVKIDRSALSGGIGLDGRFGQVGLVAGLARSIGAQVVVEGIEIHKQLQGVQFEDVTHLQGHYFGHAPFTRSWQVRDSQMPKRAGAKPPENAVQNPPVINPLYSS